MARITPLIKKLNFSGDTYAQTQKDIKEYRALAKRANQRIKMLELNGLEPKALTNIKSAIEGNKFVAPSDISNPLEFRNMLRLVRRFTNDATSTVAGARIEEEKRYEGFKNVLTAAVGRLSADALKLAYQALGDIDIAKLMADKYISENVISMMYELIDVGIKPTNDLLRRALDESIEDAVGDYLTSLIGDVENNVGDQIRTLDNYYIGYAVTFGVDAALAEYYSDKAISDINGMDWEL